MKRYEKELKINMEHVETITKLNVRNCEIYMCFLFFFYANLRSVPNMNSDNKNWVYPPPLLYLYRLNDMSQAVLYLIVARK